jgi:hypothetical protein
MQAIKRHDALKRMRELTSFGVPFKISFIKYNSTKGICGGKKTVPNALLGKGFRSNQSELSKQLIGYFDLDQNEEKRLFHLPLLLEFNNYKVIP